MKNPNFWTRSGSYTFSVTNPTDFFFFFNCSLSRDIGGSPLSKCVFLWSLLTWCHVSLCLDLLVLCPPFVVIPIWSNVTWGRISEILSGLSVTASDGETVAPSPREGVIQGRTAETCVQSMCTPWPLSLKEVKRPTMRALAVFFLFCWGWWWLERHIIDWTHSSRTPSRGLYLTCTIKTCWKIPNTHMLKCAEITKKILSSRMLVPPMLTDSFSACILFYNCTYVLLMPSCSWTP